MSYRQIMSSRAQDMDRITEVAVDQGGYVTAAQAKHLGVREPLARRTRNGDLRRVRHGVYATRGTRHSHEQEIAAWLTLERKRLPWEWTSHAEPSAVLSHRSAAAIWNLGTLVPELPSLTIRGRAPRGEGLEIHRSPLGEQDWQWERLDGGIQLPLTTPARTIVDLANAGEEPSHVERALREARQRRLTTNAKVRAAAQRLRRRNKTLRDLLSDLLSATEAPN